MRRGSRCKHDAGGQRLELDLTQNRPFIPPVCCDFEMTRNPLSAVRNRLPQATRAVAYSSGRTAGAAVLGLIVVTAVGSGQGMSSASLIVPDGSLGAGGVVDLTVGGLEDKRVGTSIGRSSPVGTSQNRSTDRFVAGEFWAPAGGEIVLAVCAGRCDGDGRVAINELVLGVGIALDRNLIAVCPSFGRDRDGGVSTSELIAAVGNALHGCQEATTTGQNVRQEVGSAFPGHEPSGPALQRRRIVGMVKPRGEPPDNA